MAITEVTAEGGLVDTRSGYIDNATIVWDADEDANIGLVSGALAVNMSAANTYQQVGDAEPVHGLLLLVEEDATCTVVTHGVVSMIAGVGGVTFGTKIVGAVHAGAEGYVRSVNAAAIGEVAVARHTAMATAIDGATVLISLEG